MNIINKVNDKSYIQWIEQFVKEVISKTNLECEEVTIEDIEHSKRIFLSIDGKSYNIRTWSFHPEKRDKNNDVCAEMVDYTLFEMVKDENGGHGNKISNGMIRIDWKN